MKETQFCLEVAGTKIEEVFDKKSRTTNKLVWKGRYNIIMDDVIEQNMGLVVSVVNSFKPRNHVEKEDYMQKLEELDCGKL